jgi:hypothetical protein
MKFVSGFQSGIYLDGVALREGNFIKSYLPRRCREAVVRNLLAEPLIELNSPPKLLRTLDTACRTKHGDQILLKAHHRVSRHLHERLHLEVAQRD